MLHKFWHYISHLGVKADTPEYLKDKIMLTNRLVLSLYAFVTINFVRIALIAPWIYWIVLMFASFYTFILVANRFGKVLFSRVMLTFVLPVMVVYIGCILSDGENYTVRLPLLMTLLGPLLIFDHYKERNWIILGIAWNFLAQMTFHLLNNHVIPNVDNLPDDINSLPNQLVLGILCSFIMILGVVYFVRQNHDAKERVHALAGDLQKSNDILALQAQTIAETNEELIATLQQISEQSDLINKKNKDIIESIEYAKRIQTTILPAEEIINSYLPHTFFYYQPKDIVSGDFYWFVHLKTYSFLAAIDCTGHGVPGAFMSVMAYNQLNQIVIENDIHDPKEILNQLDRAVRLALKQDEIGSQSRDGMDLTLIRLDHQKDQMIVASAQRPYLICRDQVFTAYKGDRFPIGYSIHEEKEFTEHTFELQSVDRIYLFTDGITDQFGGEKGRKVTMKRFEEHLKSIQNQDMKAQKISLKNFLENWKGKQEQLDDIMVIGVEWSSILKYN